MKKIPITITLPENLVRDLHLYSPQRGISSFVAALVQKGLEEKKHILAQEFREAALDKSRNEELDEWDTCIGDGLNGSNGY